jgi:hypothetical protein
VLFRRLFRLDRSIVEVCVFKSWSFGRNPKAKALDCGIYQGYDSGVSWPHLARALAAIFGGGDHAAMSFDATDYPELQHYKYLKLAPSTSHLLEVSAQSKNSEARHSRC